MADGLEHLVAGLLHDPGPRIVVLVDAVAEAHQPEGVVPVLGALDVFGDAVDRADLLQHLERRLVGAAMRRPPETGDAGRDAGEGIGARRAGQPHRGGRGVLLVVGMQNEDAAHGAREHGIDLVFLARHREAHMQKVGRVIELVPRIDEGLTDGIFVGHGGDGRHFGDHAHARHLALRGSLMSMES